MIWKLITFFTTVTIALHPREGRKGEGEGCLIAQECEWNESIRKSAYSFIPFFAESYRRFFVRAHSRGRCAQRERERERAAMTDYLVPRGSRNFAITAMSTTTRRSQFKTVISALMHVDRRNFFLHGLSRIKIIRFFFSFPRSVVTPMVFLLHATPPLAAVAAGLRHVILWQSD